jgi:hypothetical protein
MRYFSTTAWDIANKFSGVLASETRDLAAHIDDALSAKDNRIAQMQESNACIPELEAKIESNAKIIAEKDIEICSMIAVHNSDVDGMRLQEEKIADQKKTIAALREQNERLREAVKEMLRVTGLNLLATKIVEVHALANEQSTADIKNST